MASLIYNRFFANIANKEIDWDADTLRVALASSAYTENKDHTQWSDVSANEVSGTNYTAGGIAMTAPAASQDDSGDQAVLDGSDVEWETSTITARYAVIYDDTMTNDDLVAVIDFGEDKSSAGGSFKIEWNASGIITLAQA